MISSEVHNLAKKIWDYHHLNQPLVKADCIIVLGSHDTRVAEWGRKLLFDGWAPLIVFSGGRGRLTPLAWQTSEAEKFAKIAIEGGVPEDRVFIENKSTNTGENILFSNELLEKKGISLQTVIAVQKPYMERRTYATFRKVWPEVNVVVSSPKMLFEEYPNTEISEDDVINIMVGDLQRIKLYPDQGFQISQEIPDDVWGAYEKLVAAGYNKQLIK